MKKMKFKKELYPKIALIKAAYNFTDIAFLHLDADESYYYVEIQAKRGKEDLTELDFTNEMLAQSVRHEVYQETKNVRELLLARAMATSVVIEKNQNTEIGDDEFEESEILKDWFTEDE